MKLVRAILFAAAAAVSSSPMIVHGKKHRSKRSKTFSASRGDFPGLSPATTAVASSSDESTFLLRGGGIGGGGLGGHRALGSSSSSHAASGKGESSGFMDDCLVACESSGGIAVGDLIVPPTSIDDWKAAKDAYCCDGGASYLKMIYKAGNNQTGLLTVDANIAAKNSTCDAVYEQTFNLAKQSGEGDDETSHELQFVPCSDPCVTAPLGEEACVSSSNSVPVSDGTEVCLATVDMLSNKVILEQKMGTNVYVYFVPDHEGEGTPETMAGTIHASCSKPIVPPYAASLYDPCHFDEGATLINLDFYSGNIPHLAFLDGISAGYYESAMNSVGDGEDQESYQEDFDISFGHCGCTCANFDSPITEGPTPSPSKNPTLQPGAPTEIAPVLAVSPSSEPSASPTDGSNLNLGPEVPFPFPSPEACVSSCVEFVSQKCAFSDRFGDAFANQACDVTAELPEDIGDSTGGGDDGDDGRRVLRMIEFHYSRIEAIEDILAGLD